MKKNSYLIFTIVFLWIFSGCAGGPVNQAEKAEEQVMDQQIFEPYKVKNTIEGYEEFISKYPGNQFVGTAKRQIYRLKYDKYLKLDTLKGYREFIENNPQNPYTEEATRKIEKLEFRRYEKEDRVEGYREFVAQYPESYYVADAQLRIQEIEFRQLDEDLRKKYGFDLLKYRLELRRMKRNLILAGKDDPANFSCVARLVSHKGKNYFLTNLIYKDDVDGLALFSNENKEDVFDAVVFEALLHLQSYFRHKGEIDGFGFSLSVSSSGLYRSGDAKSEIYFPVESVSQFCRDLIDKETLKKHSLELGPMESVVAEKHKPSTKPGISVFSQVNAGLLASEGTFSDTILVMWYPAKMWAPSSPANGYQVYRSKEMNGNYEPISGVVQGTIYYDNDIHAGQPYYYKVKGYDQNGKAMSSFSQAVSGMALSGGIKGPEIVQGMPLVEGDYVYKPANRAYPIYHFDKNGKCLENNFQHRLTGRWYYEGRNLFIKTGIEDLSYTVSIVERWEDAFTTHNGRRFNRMGVKQVRHGANEAMKFVGKGRIQVVGTGLAKRNNDTSLELTMVLDKAGIWHTTFVSGRESQSTATPHPKKDFEIAQYNDRYFLAVPAEGPGYFRE